MITKAFKKEMVGCLVTARYPVPGFDHYRNHKPIFLVTRLCKHGHRFFGVLQHHGDHKERYLKSKSFVLATAEDIAGSVASRLE